MAITLEGNYSKKVGLRSYSSHQFSLTLKTEISDLTQVQGEAARLYQQLQEGVDASIKQIGWLPETNGNGNGNGTHVQPHAPKEEPWQCSPKQQSLILKIVDEHHLDKNDVEKLAQERFGKGVKQLNKLEASGLIEELCERHPRQNRHNGRQPVPAR